MNLRSTRVLQSALRPEVQGRGQAGALTPQRVAHRPDIGRLSMPQPTVHPSNAATRITILRDAVRRLADELDAHNDDVHDAGTATDLAAERYVRLAEFALTRAARREDLAD